jgi:hypothetical protein
MTFAATMIKARSPVVYTRLLQRQQRRDSAKTPQCSWSSPLSLCRRAGVSTLKQGKEDRNKTQHGNCRAQIGYYDEHVSPQ